MSRHRRISNPALTGAAATLLALCGSARGLGQEIPDVPRYGGPPKEESEKKVKVFRLTQTDPDEAQRALNEVLKEASGRREMRGVPVGGPPGFPGGQFPPGGPPGFGPGPGGGFGVPAPAAPSYHLAVDRRTRALIVRGAPRHLELAAEFVALLDRPEGKPPPEVKTLWAQRLRHADPEAIDAVLTQLDLGVRCIALPNSGAVVLTGAEPALKEARKLIEELDIPAPEDAAPPPPKEVDKKELDKKE